MQNKIKPLITCLKYINITLNWRFRAATIKTQWHGVPTTAGSRCENENENINCLCALHKMTPHRKRAAWLSARLIASKDNLVTGDE